jgi:hypothetical protein
MGRGHPPQTPEGLILRLLNKNSNRKINPYPHQSSDEESLLLGRPHSLRG